MTRTLAIVAVFVSVIFGLTMLWWWAIVGLSQPVGMASLISSGVLMFVGFMRLVWDD